MGRPKLPEGARAVMCSFRLRPDTVRDLVELSELHQCSQADVISMLVFNALNPPSIESRQGQGLG
jgi:hypothetical protein